MSTNCQADRGLNRAQRLVHSRLFAEAYAQRRGAAGRLMLLWLRAGPGAALRVGVVAGRRIGGAVDRNRARRRLREAFRLNRARFRPGYDVVLVARRPVLDARWPEVERELLALAGRVGLVSRAGRD